MCASDRRPGRMPRAFVAVGLLMLASVSHGQPSKDDEQLKRVRMQMRQIQQQQQEAQEAQARADQARRQAEQSLKAQESALQKQRAAAATASRQAASLARELETLKDEHARMTEELAALTARHKALDAGARGLREQLQTSQDHAQRLNTAGLRLLDMNKRCVADNLQLADLGMDILQRYEDKGIAEVLGAREPFLQFGRVKLENLKGEYARRIEAASLKGSDTSAGVDAKAFATTPSSAP